MKTIQLFLVDDEPQVRQGLRMRLEMEPDFEVVGEAGDGCTAIAAVVRARPDVVLMDIDMPRKDGVTATKELRRLAPESAVIIVSMQDDAATRARALAAGAVGFVGKHEIDTALTRAIRAAAPQAGSGQRLCGWIAGAPVDPDDPGSEGVADAPND